MFARMQNNTFPFYDEFGHKEWLFINYKEKALESIIETYFLVKRKEQINIVEMRITTSH